MESYFRNDSVSAYELGLANPEQPINISQEGNPFEQLIDFKINGLDLSSYGFTGLTPSNSGSYSAISPTQSMTYSSLFENNTVPTYPVTTTICPDLIAQPSSMKQISEDMNISISIQKPENTILQNAIQNYTQPKEIIPSPSPSSKSNNSSTGLDYFDITPYIQLSQEKAARKLGIPKSTLSKRWREATCNRKWPYRQLCKLDREIKTLIHNMQTQGSRGPQLQENLSTLMKLRQEESRVVYIKNLGSTLSRDDNNYLNSTPVKVEPIKLDGIKTEPILKIEALIKSNQSTLPPSIWAQALQSNLASDLTKNLNLTNL